MENKRLTRKENVKYTTNAIIHTVGFVVTGDRNEDYNKALKKLYELEALQSMKDCLSPSGDIFEHTKEYKIIKRALIRADIDTQTAEQYDEIIKKQEKILNILKDSPFILQKIFENKGLKSQEEFDKRYFWGTITEDKCQIIEEWLENE